MESIFDLDVEHMSALFVSDYGQLENMFSVSDVFDIFRKCCYLSHAPTRPIDLKHRSPHFRLYLLNIMTF